MNLSNKIFLASHFAGKGCRITIYSPSQGVRELIPENRQCQAMKGINGQGDPMAAFNDLKRLLKNPNEKWLVLVNYPEHLAPGS